MIHDVPESQEAAQAQTTIADALSMGLELHKQNRLKEAEYIYRTILEAVPEQVEALNFLGVLLHQEGHTQAGVELISKAITVCPTYVDAQTNLGNVLRWQGKLPEAAAAFRRAIELAPGHVDAYNNLGVILKNQRQYEQANACLRRAIELDPNRGDSHYNLANVLDQCGGIDEAAVHFRLAIELKPALVDAYDALARSLVRHGKQADALKLYDELLERVPNHPIAQHMRAAMSGENTPLRASNEYVASTFDRFAENFDSVIGGLEYQAPQLVAAAVAADLPASLSGRQLNILDAGCGTGLCGPLLRPLAAKLVGIDLSQRMIEKTRQREIYDQLVLGELTEFLRQSPNAFDIIASADTLNYFGDLAAVLGAAAGALRSGGRLVFTLEINAGQPTESGYCLALHGRYGHDETYVCRALEQAGFNDHAISRGCLRRENHQPVGGLIITASRSS
jgi:predicted TPR repeat methyltransferase